MPEEEEEELQMSSSNLNDAAKGKTDTIILTSGKKGGRKVKGEDLPAVLMQAGVKKDWQGTLVIAFPDVCKTPAPAGPVPIPYPNIGAVKSGAGKKVKVEQALHQAGFKGIHVTSVGDEAGSAKGVVGAKAMTGGSFGLYSFDVKAEGKPVLRGHELMHVTQQSSHVPHMVPSQTKPIK
ncbi:PAAR-like domain-containing protein [Vannielia litorea]|uniref:PAAR-like domain-containing protein n=1 Tax=Vannielia litorea TaxID=1217970 RepID=UPI001BD00BA4|nr:PAAR-like domain-containing protein [Vannielia litorea]MBS8228284.1 DUF4150 domain-containing protein [Vannielia litorea]